MGCWINEFDIADADRDELITMIDELESHVAYLEEEYESFSDLLRTAEDRLDELEE